MLGGVGLKNLAMVYLLGRVATSPCRRLVVVRLCTLLATCMPVSTQPNDSLAPVAMPTRQLVELVAAPELSALFSQAELAELLQCERAAAVLQMRNAEQQAAALGGRQQQQQQQEGEDAGEAGLEPEGRDQQGDEAAGQ